MINNNTIVINLVMNYSICELNSQMSLNFFHFPKYENGINAQLSFNDTKFYILFFLKLFFQKFTFKLIKSEKI